MAQGMEIANVPGDGNGLFVRNRSFSLKEVLDGTSTTIALGERGAILAQTPWAGTPNQGVANLSIDAPSNNPGPTHGAELVVAHAADENLNAGTPPPTTSSARTPAGSIS